MLVALEEAGAIVSAVLTGESLLGRMRTAAYPARRNPIPPSPYRLGEAEGLTDAQISAQQGALASQQMANENAAAHGQPLPFPAAVLSAPTTARSAGCPPGYVPNPGGEGCVPVQTAARPAGCDFSAGCPTGMHPSYVTCACVQDAPPAFVVPPPTPAIVFTPPPATPPFVPPPSLDRASTPTSGGGGGGGAGGGLTPVVVVGGAILAFLYFGRRKGRRRR